MESLGLYGSACIKAPSERDNIQEISFLVDVKVAGVQVEVSTCAAEAVSSVLATMMPEKVWDNTVPQLRPTYSRQVGDDYVFAVI